jgi:hypothetical protein
LGGRAEEGYRSSRLELQRSTIRRTSSYHGPPLLEMTLAVAAQNRRFYPKHRKPSRDREGAVSRASVDVRILFGT